MKTSSFLRRVKRLLASPKRWFKGYWAANSEGVQCRYDSPDAACFCLSGAVRRSWNSHLADGASGDNVDGAYKHLRDAVAKVTRGRTKEIPAFNDAPRRTHAQVIRVLDIAIKAADKEEKGKKVGLAC